MRAVNVAGERLGSGAGEEEKGEEEEEEEEEKEEEREEKRPGQLLWTGERALDVVSSAPTVKGRGHGVISERREWKWRKEGSQEAQL